MTQINLLPWREQERQLKRLRFLSILLSFIGFTLVLIFLLHVYYAVLISQSNKQVNLMQASLQQESKALMQLNAQNKEKIKIDTDVKFLIELHKQSYAAIRLLDELPRIIPEAVSLTRLERNNRDITLIGKAGSNLQVTLFMENIGKSKYFKQPILTEITGKENASGDERFFKLKLEQEEY